jgi:hypothetical protein
MSSLPPVPTPPRGPALHADTAAPPGDNDAHDRLLADWTDHIQRMAPEDLRLLVVSLPLIEQAKGILMGHYGCDAATAFTILRRWSSTQKIKLRDLAAALVAEASRDGAQGDGQPSDAVDRFRRAHGLG